MALTWLGLTDLGGGVLQQLTQNITYEYEYSYVDTYLVNLVPSVRLFCDSGYEIGA